MIRRRPELRFTPAELLKFELLADGLEISARAAMRLDALRSDRPLSPADFASTSGVILNLEDDVWVNAPIRQFNPNFVDRPGNVLDVEHEVFVVRGADELESFASVWLPPGYHGQVEIGGRSVNDFVFSHGDRVRLSPIRGCAMKCKFCNVPYDDPHVETKPMPALVAAIRTALADPLQPAQHVLISGGTPRKVDVPYLSSVYETVLSEFPEIDVDIMMVPVEGLFDLPLLKSLGLHELSINIELSNREAAKQLMPQKARQGIDRYLRFISEATEVLGSGRVRSMVMVGLESVDDTIAGVSAIIDAGGVPVLSPFRPDPSTPLRDWRPLSASELRATYEAALSVAHAGGTRLGPDCVVCTHNTLTFARNDGEGGTAYRYPRPVMV